MKSFNIYKNIFLFSSFFSFLTLELSFEARADKNKTSFDSKSIANLSFTNCEKLTSLLSSFSGNAQVSNRDELMLPLSAVQKQELSEAFSEILKLEASQSLPLNLYGPNSFGANSLGQRSGDLSLTLDPNSENDAKSCIVDNYKKLLPESISILPSLVSAASKESTTRALRGKIILALREITTLNFLELNEFVLTNLVQKLNDQSLAVESPLIIPPLAKLLSLKFDYIITNLGGLSNKAIINLVQAAFVSNPDGRMILRLLVESTHIFKNRNLRSALLTSLSSYPELLSEILTGLPEIIKSSSGEELKDVVELIDFFGREGVEYIKGKTFALPNDRILDVVLSLITQTSYTNLDNVVALLSELKVNADSKLCNLDNKLLLELESDKSRYAREIIIASVCPLTKKSVDFYSKEFINGGFLAKVVSTVALTKSPANQDILVKEILKSAKVVSPKEYKQLCFLFLDRAYEYKNIKLIILAEKLILEEQIYPLYLRGTGSHNPSLSYFAQLGKQSLPVVKKLLTDQASSFHRESGLRVVSSPEFPFYKELVPLLIALLSDKDLETRRSAYLALLRSKEPLNELSSASQSGVDTIRFYSSRVLLNSGNTLNQKILESLLNSAVSASTKLSCQERTSPIPKIELLGTAIPKSEFYMQFITSQLECLSDNSQIRKRSIDNLYKLSPLPESLADKLSQYIMAKGADSIKFQVQDYIRIGDILFSSYRDLKPKLDFISNLNKLAESFDKVAKLNYVRWLIQRSLQDKNNYFLTVDEPKGRIYDLGRLILSSYLDFNSSYSKSDILDGIISVLRDLELDEISLVSFVSRELITELILKAKELGNTKYSYLKMYTCNATLGHDCKFLEESIADVLSEDSKLRLSELSMISKLLESGKDASKNELLSGLSNRLIVSVYSGELFKKDILDDNKLIFPSISFVRENWQNQIEKNIFERSERIARSHHKM